MHTRAMQAASRPGNPVDCVPSRFVEELGRHASFSPTVLGLTDAEMVIQWISPNVRGLLGFDPVQVVGRTALDLVHPDDHPKVGRQLRSLLRGGNPSGPLVVAMRHHDGHWLHVDISGVDLVEHPGIGGVVINLRDVTDIVAAQKELSASEERFRALVQHSSDAVCVLDADGSITYASPAVSQLFGHAPGEVVGADPADFAHPMVMEAGAALWDELLSTDGLTLKMSSRVKDASGRWRWVEASLTNLLSQPAVAGIVVNIRDVTEHTIEELRNRRLSAVIAETSDFVAITDGSGRLLYANEAARAAAGIRKRDLGRPFRPPLPSWAESRVQHEVAPALAAHGRWEGELALVRRGVEKPVSTVMIAHRTSEQTVDCVSVIARDITDRKDLEAALEHQATHDPLTGLPNRALLLDRLDVELDRAHRTGRLVALLFIDLDRFKVVNDSLGHDRGDQILVATAIRLSHLLQQTGHTVSRFGGDEFLVLCADLESPADAINIADEIRRCLAHPFLSHSEEVVITASIGVAMSDRTREPHDLIRDADAAMYRAKAGGRDRHVVFTPNMRAEAVDRLLTERSLRLAIADDQFVLHYQPIRRISTNEQEGREALIRWQHPERGELLPDEFMRVAEETGLIVPIGRWVLEEAIRHAAEWLPANSHDRVAVNLSRRQLSDPSLVTDLAAMLKAAAVTPRRIVLEITESVIMDDVELAHRVLSELHELGVTLAIDDFGTGYSSLSYLQRFPVDLLKVDRSFIAGLGVNRGDTAIVTAVLHLARTLGMEVIAEGVETAVQLEELRRLGCDMAQGFYLGPPRPLALA